MAQIGQSAVFPMKGKFFQLFSLASKPVMRKVSGSRPTYWNSEVLETILAAKKKPSPVAHMSYKIHISHFLRKVLEIICRL